MPEIVYHEAERGFWNKDVRDYYIKKRRVPESILRLMRGSVIADMPSLTAAVSLAELKQGGKWRKILADLGEAAASWYLETKKSIYLVKLRWVDFPLRIMEGLDLMGYESTAEEIAVAESKVINNPNPSSTASRLAEQLSRSRIDAELDSPLNEYGSKVWLVQELLDRGIISDEQVDELLSKAEYTRFGFLFHPPSTSLPNYSQMGDKLEAEGLPVTFVDYTLADLEHEVGSFVEVLEINKELIGNAKPD
jgi:hypothetical protein